MIRIIGLFFYVLYCFFPFALFAKERKVSQKEFLRDNYEYIISDTCNLESKEIKLPKNSRLRFKKNGCIKNGTIVFNGCKIINPHFVDCKYEGDIKVTEEIIDSTFCKNGTYDQDVLWWLIEQTAKNCTTLELTKDYTICSARIYSFPYAQDKRSYVILENMSFKIKGNKHTIYDTYKHSGHFGKDFIVLKHCHNVQIESLYFIGLHNEINNIANKGANKFPAPGGTNVILCIGDTKNIKIVDGKCSHCCSYIWCGNDVKVDVESRKRNYYTDNLVVNGFENFDIEVDAFDTQYPIAIYKGRNIKIKLHFLYARRGCRLQGVQHADINISGAFVTTPVMLLLKDVISYTDDTFSTRVYNACSDISAYIRRNDVTDTVTNYKWYDIALNIGCYGGDESLATSDQFKVRKTPYLFRNINVQYECNAQQYAVLLSRNNIGSLRDIYDLTLTDCHGGGIEGAGITNNHSELKLSISNCKLNKISMNFNNQDQISIVDSKINLFDNKSNTTPQIKTDKSKINFVNR